MPVFDIEVDCCLGMSHCGGVMADNKGTIELTDEEVSLLVALIKEKGTAEIDRLQLEEALPEIYEKLRDAYQDLANDAVDDHWLWGYYYECYGEVDDFDTLLKHCYENCGFEFWPDEYFVDDYDEDGFSPKLREAESKAFYEWLPFYLKSLSCKERVRFFINHMNYELEEYGASEDDYEIAIPKAIVAMAFPEE